MASSTYNVRINAEQKQEIIDGLHTLLGSMHPEDTEGTADLINMLQNLRPDVLNDLTA
ncbi:hypothetical protein KAR91_47820 [Candidatus Pacearchaeota archaeon]|nr:hypothetical protein [Candidatus Pacearchaeota archaeon]